MAPAGAGALEEQLDRVARAAASAATRQPGHREHPLERHQQPGPAGGQHRAAAGSRRAAAPAGPPRRPAGARSCPAPAASPGRQASSTTVSSAERALALAEAERRRDGRRDHRRVGDRHQVDEPDAVGEPVGQLGGDAQRQPRLADPARPDGRDQAMLAERIESGPPARPTRPTNDVSGDGSGADCRRARVRGLRTRGRRDAASARRSSTWSLRSNEETWLSTVRTEMNSRAAISAFVRCSPSAASTSASRAEMPTPRILR